MCEEGRISGQYMLEMQVTSHGGFENDFAVDRKAGEQLGLTADNVADFSMIETEILRRV